MEKINKELFITGDSLLADIQEEFNSNYNYLKIEFFRKERNVFFFKSHKINPDTLLSQIVPVPVAIKINIENYRTIADIERDFKDKLGLSIHVSRKSGNVWNVISLTDNWTLESQNKAGEFISLEMATAS